VEVPLSIKQVIVAAAVLSAAASSQAMTLSEGFDDVGSLTGSGWALVNDSSAPVGSDWFQGNPGIFPAASGAADAYVAANFLSTASASGSISNWLMSPALLLDGSSTVSFLVRTAGDDFLDTLEVRLSTSGSSTDVADFGTLLGSFSASTATGWVGLTFSTGVLTAVTEGRIGFRYVVDDVSLAGNYIGIDSVSITAVPEPGTYLLMALGVAALLLRRRAAL
jgi:hypothetical protein